MDVFADYIRESPDMDLVWSDKLRYVYQRIDLGRRDIGMVPTVIETPDMLCEELIGEIVQDVLLMTGKEHDGQTADAMEIAEIRERIRPYLDQLPEYSRYMETFMTL